MKIELELENVKITIPKSVSETFLCYADIAWRLIDGGEPSLYWHSFVLKNGKYGHFLESPCGKPYDDPKTGEKKYPKYTRFDHKVSEGKRAQEALLEEVLKAYNAKTGNNSQSNNSFQDSDNIPW